MQGKKLRKEVLRIIHDNWPIHVREVIKLLNWDPYDITNVSKIRYHFHQLKKEEKIRTKKIGRALVAWPVEMEKLRLIHELLKEEEEV